MAATFNSTSNNGFESGQASPAWAHTLQAGSNLVAVVVASWAGGSNATLDTVTYGAQTMTRVTSSKSTDASGGDGHVELFYLIAPSGNQTVTCNFSAACVSVCGIVVAQGAHQTVPLGTAVISPEDPPATITPSITVTSATDEISVAGLTLNLANDTDITATVSGDERWRDSTGSSSVAMDGACSTITGSASAVHSWTAEVSYIYAASGVSIKPAAGAPASAPSLMMMGIG